MLERRKLWMLLLLGMATAALILLSTALTGLELLPGQPFILSGEPSGTGGSEALPGAGIFALLFRAMTAIFVSLLPVAIIYFIVSPGFRKRVLRDFLPMLLLFLMFYLLMRSSPDFLRQAEEGQPLESLAKGFPEAPTPEFVATPPQWLVVVANLVLALLIAALVVGAVWLLWRLQRQRVSPLERLAQEAKEAIEALQAGADLKNTVMRCYYQMSQVLREQRGIRRQRATTPREFERQLEQLGLPGEQVRQLTRLFEKVRYGAKTVDEDEARQAIACLTVIVEFCRSS
jgi:preprotein translocase subunit YajC